MSRGKRTKKQNAPPPEFTKILNRLYKFYTIRWNASNESEPGEGEKGTQAFVAACALFLSAVFPTDGGRGLIGTLAAFGSVAAFALAPDDVGGMKNAILFYSIALMVCGVLVMIFLADNKPVKAEIKAENPLNMKDFLQVARIPRVWLCGILCVCNYSALIFHGYITGYLSEAFDISSTVVANLSVIRTYFMMMVGSLAAGILADKLGSRIKFMQYAYVGMAL